MAFSQEMADLICQRLSEGESLRSATSALRQLHAHAPSMGQFLAWCDERPEIAEQYTRARALLLEHHAQQIMDIADTPVEGVTRTTKADGSVEEKAGDMIEHRRLQIESRKWILSRLLPKRYGDRQHIEHSGSVSIADSLRAAKDGRKAIRNDETRLADSESAESVREERE